MDEDQPDESAPAGPSERRAVVVLAVVVEGGLVVLALLLGWLLGQPPLRTFAWDYAGALWGLAGTLPMALLFLLILRWPVGPLRPIRRFSEEVLRPMLAPCSVLDLLA